MSETDGKPEVTEVDMGQVGVVADAPPEMMVKQNINQFIDAIYNTDYTSAEKQFSDMVSDRLQAQLDQAKVAMSGQMFNNDESEEEVESEEEEVELEVEEEEDTAEREGKEIFSGSYLEN